MIHTLREDNDRKNFNEDKPWKGHHGITHLSERERKRYAALWAANRRTHLPYLYVVPAYADHWDSLLRTTYPELYKNDTGARSAPGTRLSAPYLNMPSPEPNSHFNITVSDHTDDHTHQSTPTSEDFGAQYDNPQIRDRSNIEDLTCSRSPGSLDFMFDIEKQIKLRGDDVHGYVVSRIWRRSRLPEEILREIWDLVDLNRDGTLDRAGFVVGMWLCDQCLYGRKLPTRVPEDVWNSVGKLHLKVRVKQKVSTFGYVKNIPNLFGSALGHTMHGGRRVVKKAVQSATS